MKWWPRSYIHYYWDSSYIYFLDEHEMDFDWVNEKKQNYSFSPGYWMKRNMKIWDVIDGSLSGNIETKIKYSSGAHSCPSLVERRYSMKLILENHLPNYDLGGDLGIQDVIVLRVEQHPELPIWYSEKEYYAKWYWLVKWEYCNLNWTVCSNSVTFNTFSDDVKKLDKTSICKSTNKVYQILLTGQSLARLADCDDICIQSNRYIMSSVFWAKYYSNPPIISNHAQGSTPYVYLKKNATWYLSDILKNAQWLRHSLYNKDKIIKPYELGMEQLKAINDHANKNGKEHQVMWIIAIHWETDEWWKNTTKEEYKKYLVEWQRDYQLDIESKIWQKGIIPLYTCQTSSFNASWFIDTTPTIALAQLEASEENKNKIILVWPKYFLNYDYTNLHLDESLNGRNWSRLLSEYYSKVFSIVYNQWEEWKPLMPINITLKDKTILAKFHLPQNATWLVFDTKLLDEMPNKWFEYFDSKNSSKIVEVEIINNDTVKITLDKIPTWNNPELAYAYTWIKWQWTWAHKKWSAKWNLRDNDTTVWITMPNVHLYNWAVHFKKPITILPSNDTANDAASANASDIDTNNNTDTNGDSDISNTNYIKKIDKWWTKESNIINIETSKKNIYIKQLILSKSKMNKTILWRKYIKIIDKIIKNKKKEQLLIIYNKIWLLRKKNNLKMQVIYANIIDYLEASIIIELSN